MNFNIEVENTGIPEGVMQLIEQFPDLNQLTDENITIALNFNDAYILNTGLVLLATWRKSLPRHVNVVVNDFRCEETAKRHLINSGFKEIIEQNIERPSNIHYRRVGKVPLQPVVRGYSTEQAIVEISEGLKHFANQLGDTQPFVVLLSELCENTFAHSQFETPGYIASNFHPRAGQAGRCEIAIADSGIGIVNSYLEGTNDEIKTRIRGGASAIELALDGLHSSKPTPVRGTLQSHFGYGLFIVRRLIEENQGRLTIISGNECVNVERHQKNRYTLQKPWPGTFVGLLIDLANPLPLEDVYDEGTELRVPLSKPKSKKNHIEDKQEIKVKEVSLANYGAQLLTRELGIAIRADIATILSSGSKVKISLEGIEDITPSVADECFGKLAESMGFERFQEFIIFTGGQNIVERLIRFVINNRLPK